MRCCSTSIGLSQQRHQPARPQQGQPDQGDQHAGADDRPAVEVQPDYTCLLIGAQDAASTTGATTAPGGNGSRSIAGRGVCCSATTRTAIRTTCRSSAPRADRAASRAAARCRTSPKNFPVRQLITNTGWGTGVDCPAQPGYRLPRLRQLLPGHPRRCPSRRASATSAARHRDRSRTRARRPTAHRCTRRTALRCTRAAAGTAAGRAARSGRRPGRSRSWCRTRAAAADPPPPTPIAGTPRRAP